MTKNEYNGWTNYETWNVALWLDNEEGSYSYWRERAEELVKGADGDDADEKKENAASTLADELKDQHEENNPVTDASVYSDLMSAALSEVNWYEIAKHYTDEVEIEEETEEESA